MKRRPKSSRRQEAELRQAKHSVLTPEQKLAKLDSVGWTATKERAKLTKQIQAKAK